ncbi:hypothetical protein B0I35DRAFT_432942 [Stachybotrys elegans]|uniref:Myb-like domain-containing protein n=1 Tax=Stachybotrys elegans TaxID=80388 RepID=A0A8K0SRZ5_9HYPO|nr:hypothetical protein B0I35DRAFT_432942 [Stachybotrys elegans]
MSGALLGDSPVVIRAMKPEEQSTSGDDPETTSDSESASASEASSKSSPEPEDKPTENPKTSDSSDSGSATVDSEATSTDSEPASTDSEKPCLKKQSKGAPRCLKANEKTSKPPKAVCKKKAAAKNKACKKKTKPAPCNASDSGDADESAVESTDEEASAIIQPSEISSTSEASTAPQSSASASDVEPQSESDVANLAGDEASTSATDNGFTTTDDEAATEEVEQEAPAEKKVAEAPAKQAEKTKEAPSGSSTWTLSEDALLTTMKTSKSPLSWVEISKALGRSKKELKARWGEIKDRPRKPDSDDEAQDQPEAAKPAKVDDDAVSMTSNNVIPSRKKHEAEKRGGHELAIYAPSSASDAANERRQQAEYLREHIWKELYPPSAAAEADDHFTQAMCDSLAAVHSKYQLSKWLEMQANFYNATGLLVPIEDIRRRCETSDEDLMLVKRVRQWVEETDNTKA